MNRIKQKLDWNFVIKWSFGLSIFLFGMMCMTARDAGIRAYYLSGIDNQKISWTVVEQKIIPQIIVGGFVSFILLILSFVVLMLWAYFVRKTPNYSESQIQEKIKPILTALLVISTAIGLMFLYYSLVENRGHMLTVEAIAVIALACFVRIKQNLFVCYVLLAAFLYLLIKSMVRTVLEPAIKRLAPAGWIKSNSGQSLSFIK